MVPAEIKVCSVSGYRYCRQFTSAQTLKKKETTRSLNYWKCEKPLNLADHKMMTE